MAATEMQSESINMPASLSFSYFPLVHSFLQKVRKFTGNGGTRLKSLLRKQRQKDYKFESPQNIQWDCLKINRAGGQKPVIKEARNRGVRLP